MPLSILVTRPFVFDALVNSFVSKFLSNFQLFPKFLPKITWGRKYWYFSVKTTQNNFLFLQIIKAVRKWKTLMRNIFFIYQDLIFFSHIIPFNVVWVSQNKKVFPIVFKTDMIDPDSHVWKNVINWM